MVNLQQYGETSDRQVQKTVQALDDIHLPQRAVQIQWARVDARRLDTELTPITRLGQGDMVHVVLDIEVIVFNPVRIVQIQRNPQDFFAEIGQLVEPTVDMGQNLLEAHNNKTEEKV